MEHAEYVYTSGMSESDVDGHLRASQHGVLALADDDDAYAVPLSYRYDGERFLLRVSGDESDSEKERFIETTDTATVVCYEGSATESWSVLVRGPLREWEGDVDEETLNEWFPPFRLFDEAVERVGFSLYELRMETVVGRGTAG